MVSFWPMMVCARLFLPSLSNSNIDSKPFMFLAMRLTSSARVNCSSSIYFSFFISTTFIFSRSVSSSFIFSLWAFMLIV